MSEDPRPRHSVDCAHMPWLRLFTPFHYRRPPLMLASLSIDDTEDSRTARVIHRPGWSMTGDARRLQAIAYASRRSRWTASACAVPGHLDTTKSTTCTDSAVRRDHSFAADQTAPLPPGEGPAWAANAWDTPVLPLLAHMVSGRAGNQLVEAHRGLLRRSPRATIGPGRRARRPGPDRHAGDDQGGRALRRRPRHPFSSFASAARSTATRRYFRGLAGHPPAQWPRRCHSICAGPGGTVRPQAWANPHGVGQVGACSMDRYEVPDAVESGRPTGHQPRRPPAGRRRQRPAGRPPAGRAERPGGDAPAGRPAARHAAAPRGEITRSCAYIAQRRRDRRAPGDQPDACVRPAWRCSNADSRASLDRQRPRSYQGLAVDGDGGRPGG